TLELAACYAVSQSTVQLLAILMVALLTWTNTRGLDWGRIIQNVFTTTKTGARLALIATGLLFAWNATALNGTLGGLRPARGATPLAPGLDATPAYGVFVALCV